MIKNPPLDMYQMRHIYSEYDAIEILTAPSIKTTLIPLTIKIIKHANLKY